jgi:hypothetical protein
MEELTMRKKKVALMNRSNNIAVTVTGWDRELYLNIREVLRWDGEPMIQTVEAGTEEPWNTLSRVIMSSEKGLTRFVVNMEDANVNVIRQLVNQGVIILYGEIAEIRWPDQEKAWKELCGELNFKIHNP